MNTPMAVALAALITISGTKTALAVQYFVLGVGQNSCARWTTNRDPSVESQTQVWIMGFWSGLNFAAGALQKADAKTGSTTDGDGIIGEVRKWCKERPSLGVGSATYQVYLQFLSSGE